MKKKIILAKNAGFCYGVKRAVETTKKLRDKYPEKKIYILGELIHNSNVISNLNDIGIKTVDELPISNDPGICVIRSHGAKPEVFQQAKKLGYEIVDLTCPDVKKVQQKAVELVKDNYTLLILGKAQHPEVIAIKACAQQYSENVYIVSCENEVRRINLARNKIGIVIQTTQQIELLKKVVDYLIPLTKDLKVFNTICPSTSKRQIEAIDLAKSADLMIIVGSKKSANTTHLAEIVKNITLTIHIEDNLELKDYIDLISKSNIIGITAGASTPNNIINKVIDELKNIN